MEKLCYFFLVFMFQWARDKVLLFWRFKNLQNMKKQRFQGKSVRAIKNSEDTV